MEQDWLKISSDLDDGTGLVEILVNSRWWTRVGWKFSLELWHQRYRLKFSARSDVRTTRLVENFSSDLNDGTGSVENFSQISMVRQDWSKIFLKSLTSELPVEIFQWDLDGGQDWLNFLVRSRWWGRSKFFSEISMVDQDWLKFFLRSRWWIRVGQNFFLRSRWWNRIGWNFSVRSR